MDCSLECRKKSHRKKSHGKKVTVLGRKKSHRKKSHKNEIFFLLNMLYFFMLEMDIIIFIITNIKIFLFGLMSYVLIINFQSCQDEAYKCFLSIGDYLRLVQVHSMYIL